MASIADVYVTVLPETGKIAAGIEKALRSVDVKAIAESWQTKIEKALANTEVSLKLKVDKAKAQKEIEDTAKDKRVLFNTGVNKPSAAKTETEFDAVAHDRTVEYKAEVDDASVARAGKKISKNLQMASGTGKGFFAKSGAVNVPFRASIPLPIAVELVGAAPAIVPAIGSMVQGIGQLTGALGLIPAAVGAAGLAIGSLKIGLSGFGEAMKSVRDPEKFAEALKELSPAAQDAARSLQGLMPQVLQLRATVQEALFTGMGEEFSKLGNTYLPIFQDVMSRMASSAGTAFGGLSKMLQTPEMQTDIKTFGRNASQAFSNLLQAVNPLVQAFTDIAVVGSEFLPDLAAAAGDLAKQFSDFIGEARESGKLSEWIAAGIGALTDLKDIAFNVWNIFKGIFEAAGGGDFLQTVVNLTTEWSNWINSVEGQSSLKTFFDEAKHSLQIVWDLAKELGPILYNAFIGFKSVIDEVLPLVTQIADLIGQYPGWIQAAAGAFALWKLTTILTDITKIGAALLGLQATAATAGTGIKGALSGALAGVSLGTLTINLAIAGGALAIWAGEKLLAAGKTIQLPVGDVGGSGLNPVNDNLSVTEQSKEDIAARRAGTPQPTAQQQTLDTLFGKPSNAPPPVVNRPGIVPAVPRTGPSPNALPDVSDQNAPPIIAGPPVNQGGGGGGSGGAGGTPEPVAPAGLSYDYTGYGELNWDALAELESGNNPKAISENGVYKGLYQFDDATWRSVGGDQFAPTADQASEDDQTKCAIALYNSRGTAPWPANGWVLEANEEQLKAAGLTSTGRRRSGSGRGGAGSNRGGYGAGAPQPVAYGLAGGTNTGGYGNAKPGQFPEWVTGITSSFGVKPSTYPGHQESNRNEAGYAPNPQGLNRGIDWSGSPAQMRAMAEYLMQNPEMVEQLIYQDPETGKAYEISGGKVSPGYYGASTLAQHRGHAHTRQSQSWGPGMEMGDGYTYDGPGGDRGNPMYIESAKGPSGEQLGKDIVSGVMEIFGFGDLFKDPTQFGLFKIFKSLMGVRPGGNLDNGSGDGSGGHDPMSSLSGGTGNPLIDTMAQFIPGGTGNSIQDDLAGWMGSGGSSNLSGFQAPGQFGTGTQPTNIDNSRTLNVAGNVDSPAMEEVDNMFLSDLRNTPKK